MLSRIAESMFWIGRYVERAEDTARILDVQLQIMLEDPSVEEDSSSRAVRGHGAAGPPGRTQEHCKTDPATQPDYQPAAPARAALAGAAGS